MKKIKIGIIGTGVGIRTHLKGFRNFLDEAEVYAIAGSNLHRSKQFADEYNIPIACADYKELCDIEDLDFLSKEDLDPLKQFVNQDNELVFTEGTKIIFESEDKFGQHGIIHGVSLDFIFEDEDTQLMEIF